MREIRAHWGVPDHKELWFRGEDGEYGASRLRPKLYRAPEGKVLKSVADLLDIEDKLYDDFQRRAVQLCDIKSEDEWDWYSLMQHHGVPTRVLDWTDGALIALHFAVRRSSAERVNSVVFVLEPYRLLDHLESLDDHPRAKERWKEHCQKNRAEDPEEWDRAYLPDDEDGRRDVPLPAVPLLSDTTQITRRFAAQRSRFMIFGTDPSWMSNLVDTEDSPVEVIIIEAASIRAMARELRDAGITESVIFPDLDGLGRELKQSWEDRYYGAV